MNYNFIFSCILNTGACVGVASTAMLVAAHQPAAGRILFIVPRFVRQRIQKSFAMKHG